MNSSSDSESEDVKNVLDAVDTNLLSDDLFKNNFNELCEQEKKNVISSALKHVNLKSQRYLSDSENDDGTDIAMPKAVQEHIAKKLTDLINNQVQFYECIGINSGLVTKPTKSRVKLLSGFDCYVKSYEEFEYDSKGPSKKPNIKRRMLSGGILLTEGEKIKAAVIQATDILNKTEVKEWAVKKDRNDRVFNYILANNSILHAKEAITEFTKVRRRNK